MTVEIQLVEGSLAVMTKIVQGEAAQWAGWLMGCMESVGMDGESPTPNNRVLNKYRLSAAADTA
jgi:hypothetical protein